ncbi:hypothetical protein DOY81_010306 [Sarcophaga bullata]|nr:hypothetical protein DOY81_010306 [Sarcophaga bullata]
MKYCKSSKIHVSGFEKQPQKYLQKFKEKLNLIESVTTTNIVSQALTFFFKIPSHLSFIKPRFLNFHKVNFALRNKKLNLRVGNSQLQNIFSY